MQHCSGPFSSGNGSNTQNESSDSVAAVSGVITSILTYTKHITIVLLCVYNFVDKVVVGSYMGMLRIFSPHANKTSEGALVEALLLEVQLQNAIIQVEVGKFVS